MVGDLKGYGTAWYYANVIENILSLHHVTERFYVAYNSHEDFFHCLEKGWHSKKIHACKMRIVLLYLKEVDDNILTTIGTVDGNTTNYTVKSNIPNPQGR